MTVEAAKFKLSSHCGTPACDMVLQLKDGAGVLVATLMDSQRKLGFFSPQDGCASTTGHNALHGQLCMRSMQTARHLTCMWCSHADCMTHHRFGVPAVMTRFLVERILANFILWSLHMRGLTFWRSNQHERYACSVPELVPTV